MVRCWPLVALLPLLAGLPQPAPALPQQADCDAALAARRQLVADAPQLRVLLLGEFHTSRDDHAWQLGIVVPYLAPAPPGPGARDGAGGPPGGP